LKRIPCFNRTFAALFLLVFLVGSVDAAESDPALTREAQTSLHNLSDASGPGAVILVARGDDILFRGARGSASIELDVPLSAGDVFRIGSNTKPFTAAAILKLAEQGRLAMTDPLSRFLPDYPNGANITVDELCRHTSGIRDYTEIDGYFDAAIREDLGTEKLIDVFKDLPVDFPPGTDWKYSSSGYILLGAIIEKVTGKSWHAAVHDLLLAPLALKDTAYDDGATPIARRAAGYSVDASGRVVNAPYISMTQAAAAGALVSTADDLLRWMRALHTGRVLEPDSYRFMTSVVPTRSGHPTDYACGIGTLRVRGEPAFQHVGRDPGYMSETLYVAKPAVSVVVLLNTDSPRADISVVAARLAATAMGRPYPQRHPVTLTRAQMDALAGVYQRGTTGRRTIRVRDGRLYTQRDGGNEHPLRAASANELYFDEVLDYFTVTRDKSGRVVALEEFPNGEEPPLHLPRQGDAGPGGER
jgi:CubicO group peptidase (beta-lactamase class C family)